MGDQLSFGLDDTPAPARYDLLYFAVLPEPAAAKCAIETARALSHERTGRDLLFVATTGEELGLLGAETFAADPPRPLPKIVAAPMPDSLNQSRSLTISVS